MRGFPFWCEQETGDEMKSRLNLLAELVRITAKLLKKLQREEKLFGENVYLSKEFALVQFSFKIFFQNKGDGKLQRSTKKMAKKREI